MLNLGRSNTLRILKTSPHGLYLDGGRHDPVLLPKRYVTPEMKVGESLEVFLHTDSEDRLVATTETPYAQVGEIAYLEVVNVNKHVGAFLDWGLSKNLLLPFREQGDYRYKVGDGAIVAIYVDEYTNRISATTRFRRHLSPVKPDYKPNTPVHVLIFDETPLGYNAIVDKTHRGLLFHAETSDKLEPGDQFTGYIKRVHPNGNIDLRRDPAGHERSGSFSEVIMAQLKEAGGSLPFHDKTPPEEIRETFDMSKKAFKQAIGVLYKQRKILITETGIELAGKS
jgi:predicted RNA-binding protein (virulence factor B family)